MVRKEEKQTQMEEETVKKRQNGHRKVVGY
jgi:hypothetical protein